MDGKLAVGNDGGLFSPLQCSGNAREVEKEARPVQGNCRVAGTLRRAVRRTAGNLDFPRMAVGECLLLFLPQ